ncbi:MAG TPA: ABC transporter ATP-binding protein [Candidatus Dojkabacteria bacterium]|nr:ABC transporter ATP-binding protein [Candidatus Dojkabacteria bacterium]HQF37310.1 ABC transporter ATP-binding protein [Candidatus Dojkabacteria bacterium]
MKSIIQVKDLVKKYPDVLAVNKISFDVYENEIFGLLGPNGAGKTTTLEIMETLKPMTSGDVTVKGMSIKKHSQKIKEIIGVQLQSAGYFTELNLREIINIFADLYNVKIDALTLLDKVQLKDRARAKVTQLSGGQRQRFSIATTLVHSPDIIFLDEPSTGLDPQARHKLWELIEQIRNDGTTIVITTHFMDEAEYLCDRVAIIDEGKILDIAPPCELIDKLLANGFKKPRPKKEANLEDVFLSMTGKGLRE